MRRCQFESHFRAFKAETGELVWRSLVAAFAQGRSVPSVCSSVAAEGSCDRREVESDVVDIGMREPYLRLNIAPRLMSDL